MLGVFSSCDNKMLLPVEYMVDTEEGTGMSHRVFQNWSLGRRGPVASQKREESACRLMPWQSTKEREFYRREEAVIQWGGDK